MKKYKKVTIAHLGIAFKQDFLIPVGNRKKKEIDEAVSHLKDHFKSIPDLEVVITDVQYKRVPRSYNVFGE